MAGDEEVRYRVPCPDLDFAVVPTKDYPLARLHQGHAHAVVRDVYRVIDATADWICLLVATVMAASLPALVCLRELHVAVHGLPWLPEGIPELLLEI